MVSKQIIHHFFYYNKSIDRIRPDILKYLLYFEKQIIFLDSNLTNQLIRQLPPTFYIQFYNLKFALKTKYLFLFTIYILFSKLQIFFNGFSFKFHVFLKKQKKITILRAPCNHKNSKEQYGVSIYVGKLTGYVPFIRNLIYHRYLLVFFQTQQSIHLFNLNYFLLSKNANKFIN